MKVMKLTIQTITDSVLNDRKPLKERLEMVDVLIDLLQNYKRMMFRRTQVWGDEKARKRR